MTQHDKTLEQKLEEVQKAKHAEEKTSWKKSKNKKRNLQESKQSSKIQTKKITQLQQEKKELEETCKRAQFDYINLKSDMDLLQRHTNQKEKTMQTDSLIEIVKNFLPFVEELRKSLENIPKWNKKTPLAKGIELTYNKFLKTLESMNIFSIQSIGLKPDTFLHEPVSIQPTKDKKLKGKIIQEFERGFIYKKDGETKVITTSKVIIGQ